MKEFKYNLSRRSFLGQMLGLAAISFAPCSNIAFGGNLLKNRPILLCGSNNDLCGSGSGMAILSLNTNKIKYILLPFQPHSFIYSHKNPNMAWAIDKWGPYVASVDIEHGELIKLIESPPGTQFYGHGVFNAQGDTVFAVRVEEKSSKGYLAGYDPITLEEKKLVEVTPGGLHDCHLLKDGSALVASTGLKTVPYTDPNSGPRVAPSALVRVDLETGKIISEKAIDDSKQIIGHFGVLSDEKILALTSPYITGQEENKAGVTVGRLYFSDDDAPLKKVNFPEGLEDKIKGEMLSIAYNPDDGVAFVTNPVSEVMVRVNADEGKVLDHLDMKAYGVSYNPQKDVFISTADDGFHVLNSKGHSLDINQNNVNLDGAHSLLVV